MLFPASIFPLSPVTWNASRAVPIVLPLAGDGLLDAVPSYWEWSAAMPEAVSACEVRSACRAFLEPHTADPTVLADVQVIAAELVANVVRHADGRAVFHLGWQQECAILLVLDGGPGFQNTPSSTLGNPLAETGRGLALVQALSLGVVLGNRAQGGAYVCVTLPARRTYESAGVV